MRRVREAHVVLPGDRVRAQLMDAPFAARVTIAQTLVAEGGATVSARLDNESFWKPLAEDPRLVPWVLAALVWSGDPRVPTRMLRALVAHHENLEDFFTESLPAALSALGPPRSRPSRRCFVARRWVSCFRNTAGTALYQIGARHPELSAHIVEVFAEFV